MAVKPRKVLIKLSDEQWNALRSLAVGDFGWTAGTLVETLVVDYLRSRGRADAGDAAVVVPGQLELQEARQTEGRARRAARRPAAAKKPEKDIRRPRQTRK